MQLLIFEAVTNVFVSLLYASVNNSLTGTIPEELGRLESLADFNVGKHSLTKSFTLSSKFFDCTTLTKQNLQDLFFRCGS